MAEQRELSGTLSRNKKRGIERLMDKRRDKNKPLSKSPWSKGGKLYEMQAPLEQDIKRGDLH